MSRSQPLTPSLKRGFPRVSGDEPLSAASNLI